MAIVGRFGSVGEALSAQSALEAAGIASTLEDEEIVALNWLYSNAVGGVKLAVADEDEAAARGVLAEAAEADVAAAPAEAEQSQAVEGDVPLLCPECGSADAGRVPRLWAGVFVTFVVLGVGVASGQPDLAWAAVAAIALGLAFAPSHRCRNCGHRWSARGAEHEELVPPPPDERDQREPHCPRCGSTEIRHIDYRRLKAIPLLFALAMILIVPIWLVLPKWKCEQCGLRFWRPAWKETGA